MAAACLGSFGAYKLAYSRHRNPPLTSEPSSSNETVWVNKRYIPTDLRSTAPVSRYKFIMSNKLPYVAHHWVPPVEPPTTIYDRGHEERHIYASQPSDRCQEWSTLRQMLPSRGRAVGWSPPNWGTGAADGPPMTPQKAARFQHINSPMTRYAYFPV